jgi:hypothetical protein
MIFCCFISGCSGDQKTDVEKYFADNKEQIEKLKDYVLTLDSVENIDCGWDKKYNVSFSGDTVIQEEVIEEGKSVIKDVAYNDTTLYRQELSLDDLNSFLLKKENAKFPEFTIPFESFFWYDSLKTLLNLRFSDIPNVDYVYSKEVVNKSRFEPDDKTETFLNEHWYAWHPWRIVK